MIYAAPGAAGAKVQFKAKYDNFIGGKWVAPVKGAYFDVITPINGKSYTKAARSDADDIELALNAAHAAADKWGRTPAADRANLLAYLATHTELFATSNNYTVLTVQPHLPPRARAAVGKAVVDQYQLEESEKVLAPVTKFLLRHGIDAKTTWKVGHAGDTIAKFAESGKFDLLVMGSHGHGTLTNLVMGSVATAVLAHCKVPVLLVR